MAMTVLNNTASMMTLGELNKKISKVGKDLKKLSTGQRLAQFADSPSDVSISEKMRELIRSLGQNERNVQTGANLLKVAEGGVQEQLELLKTVKEKVINAANDSNTDEDRAIIQKEIDQCLKEIDDIAQTTNYNGKRLLTGDPTDYHWVAVPTIVYHPVLFHDQPIWQHLGEAQFIDGSEMGSNLIKANSHPLYNTLDGMDGPFAVFEQDTPPTTPFAVNSMGLKASYTENAFTGGVDGDPKKITLDLYKVYQNVSDFDGKGFSLGGTNYVFSYDTSKYYDPTKYKTIDISGCANVSDVAARLASTIAGNNIQYGATRAGSSVTFYTLDNARLAKDINATRGIEKSSATGGYTGQVVDVPGIPLSYTDKTETKTYTNAGIGGLPAYLKGGTSGTPTVYGTKTEKRDADAREHTVIDYNNIISKGVEGKKATVTKDLSAATAGSGIKLHGSSDAYVIFTDGNAGPSFVKGEDGKYAVPAICTVGKNYRGNITTLGSICGIEMNMSKGLSSVVFTAAKDGIAPNDNYYVDNLSNSSASSPISISYTIKQKQPGTGTSPTFKTVTYSPVKPLEFSPADLETEESQKDATYAIYNMNLKGMNDVEDIIKELNGAWVGMDYDGTHSSATALGYFFQDHAVLSQGAGSTKHLTGLDIDLNYLRTLYKESHNLFGSLQKFLKEKMPYNHIITPNANGIEIKASVMGVRGNNERIFAEKAGSLRHYDIDFNQIGGLPNSLIGKGFRVYCATDESEWWNFEFTGEKDPEFEKERGESGTATERIKTIRIDISGLKSAGEVAKAFQKQTSDVLNNKFDHFLRAEGNPNTGIVRLYDYRTNELTDAEYATLMGKGGPDDTYGWWKVADGVYDNIYEDRGDKWIDMPFWEEVPMKLPVKEFAIQDNPRANRTLWLKLPETTLDKVLETDEVSVMTKEMRDKLLGERLNEQGEDGEVTGILDKGIVYLTDANVLIGSQIKRLNLSEANIVNKKETATAAESTIRDADMAKEMVSFTKNNILMQASQAMMSQANQNVSGVLGLLQ